MAAVIRPHPAFHGHVTSEDMTAIMSRKPAGSFMLCFTPKTADQYCLVTSTSSLLNASSTASTEGTTVQQHTITRPSSGGFELRIDGHIVTATSLGELLFLACEQLPAVLTSPVHSRRHNAWISLLDRNPGVAAAFSDDAVQNELMVAGSHDTGMLGLPSVDRSLGMCSVPVTGLTIAPLRSLRLQIVRVAVGDDHIAAASCSGVGLAWGSNVGGQLGLGIRGGSRDVPTEVPALLGHVIVSVAAGSNHSIFLSATGDVFTTGQNECGSCGTGTSLVIRSPVALSFFSKHPFGSEVATTRPLKPILPTLSRMLLRETSTSELRKLSRRVSRHASESGGGGGGGSTSEASYASRNMASEGDTPRSSTGAGAEDTISVAMSSSTPTVYHDRAASPSRASVTTAGRSFYTTTSGVHAADAKYTRADGDAAILSAVGRHRNLPVMGSPGGVANDAIEASTAFMDDAGEEGEGGDAVAASAYADGRGAELDIIVDVAAGGETSFAISQFGRVYAWGNSAQGQTGTGATASCARPLLVQELQQHRITAVAAGSQHTLFLTEAGEVYGCGSGTYGRLGLGDDCRDRFTPVRIKGELEHRRAVGVAVGLSHSLVVTQVGEVFAFGDNSACQLGMEEGAGDERQGVHMDNSAGIDSRCAPGTGCVEPLLPTFLPAGSVSRSGSCAESRRRVVTPTLVPLPPYSRIVGATAGKRSSAVWTAGGELFVWGQHHSTCQLPILDTAALQTAVQQHTTGGSVGVLSQSAVDLVSQTTESACRGWSGVTRVPGTGSSGSRQAVLGAVLGESVMCVLSHTSSSDSGIESAEGATNEAPLFPILHFNAAAAAALESSTLAVRDWLQHDAILTASSTALHIHKVHDADISSAVETTVEHTHTTVELSQADTQPMQPALPVGKATETGDAPPNEASGVPLAAANDRTAVPSTANDQTVLQGNTDRAEVPQPQEDASSIGIDSVVLAVEGSANASVRSVDVASQPGEHATLHQPSTKHGTVTTERVSPMVVRTTTRLSAPLRQATDLSRQTPSASATSTALSVPLASAQPKPAPIAEMPVRRGWFSWLCC